MPSNRFYLACLRDTVGTNVAFHCIDGKGYGTNTKVAHVYTRVEAQHAWEMGREFDLPLAADKVDALTVDHVDCQKHLWPGLIPALGVHSRSIAAG